MVNGRGENYRAKMNRWRLMRVNEYWGELGWRVGVGDQRREEEVGKEVGKKMKVKI